MSELPPETFSSLAHGDAGVRHVSVAADADAPPANSILEVHNNLIRELPLRCSTPPPACGKRIYGDAGFADTDVLPANRKLNWLWISSNLIR